MSTESATHAASDLAEVWETKAAVSARLGVSSMTVGRWVKLGRFVPPVRFGPRTVRWRRAEVDLWIAERQAAAKAEPARGEMAPPWKR